MKSFFARFQINLVPLRELIFQFKRNVRGNVAIMFALSTIPLICGVGAAIDYTNASMISTKLQGVADAASLATVSRSSSPISTASGMSGSGTVSGGSSYALNFFNANLVGVVGYTGLNPTASLYTPPSRN